MSLTDVAHGILAGDLTLRVRPDTTGLDAELSAKLTAAERTAETSATRIGASSGRAVAAAEKVQVAQLRATVAEERYNAALTAEEHNVARIAAAQASLITARQRATRATAEQNAVLAEQQRAARAAAEQNAVLAEQQQHRQRSIGLGGTIGLVAATVGIEKLASAYHDGITAAERLQVVHRQTDTEIAATGGAAGVTADRVEKLSEAVAHYSGVQDTVVAGAENVLLNFTAIGDAAPDRTFDRATKAAVDLAVAQHNVRGGSIDVASQAKTLGLALNDPANGLDRLRRAGVAFTAQQREQIKAMAESGKVGEAQARILDLVERKVGGSAQAFGDTAEGQAQKAHVAYEELSRTLAVDLLPAVTKVETALTGLGRFFGEHRTITDTALAIGGVSAALFVVIKAEQAIKALRTSEVAGIGARLLGYRSLERAQVQLAAAEDRHAESAGRVAVAETAAGRATAESAVVAEEASASQAASAGAGATRGGLFNRLLRRGETVAGGAGGSLAADAGGSLLGAVALPAAFAATAGLGAATLITGTRRNDSADQLVAQLAADQRRLASHRGTLGASQRITTAITGINANRGSGGLFDFGGSNDSMNRARQLLDELDRTYTRYLGHVDAGTAVMDREVYGHRAVIVAYQQERDAIFETDLARADSLQKRADDAEKAYQKALTFQHQVAGGNTKAVAAIEQVIGQGPAGLFDPITRTTGSAGTGSSQYTIDSARSSVTSASQSVQLDEQKLEQLRRSDTTTSLQLASAETALSKARTSAQLANERLANAEGKSADTRKSTALSLSTVLSRAAAQVRDQQATAADARKLVDEGITQPVLQQLYVLDQKAPGTFASIAEHITSAGVHKLNSDERLAHAARHSLEVAFSAANTKSAEKAAARSADLAAAAWQRAYLAAIRSPEFWQIVQTDLGKLLVGNLGVLPGDDAPGTGQHGRAPTLTQLQTQGLPGAANYNFNGPVTFTDPGAGKRAADAAGRRRRHALTGSGGHLMERP